MKRSLRITLTALLFAGAMPIAAVENNTAAPDFSLKDIDGNKRSLSDSKGKTVVLEWINHGCPFVRKHYESGNMQKLQKEFTDKGVVWLSVCSSGKGKEGHMSPAEWQKAAKEHGGFATAILLDEAGTVGKKYGAKTTPHMFIINPAGILVYQGAIDDKPSADQADVVTAKNYVRAALEETLAGQPVTTPSTKAYGCGVKYK